MPHHCAVPLCTSNSKTSPALSFHKFPSDHAARATWIKNIRRDEAAGVFEVTNSTRVCSLHFRACDYHDPSEGRKRQRLSQRKNKFLKAGAVPTKFDCFPERLRPRSAETCRKRRSPRSRSAPQSPARKRTCTGPSDSSPDPECATESGVQEEVGSTVEVSQQDRGARPTRHSDRSDDHIHCACVSRLVDPEKVEQLNSALQEERAVNAKLWEDLQKERTANDKLSEDLQKEKQRRDISFERHRHNDDKIRHYTGTSLPSVLPPDKLRLSSRPPSSAASKPSLQLDDIQPIGRFPIQTCTRNVIFRQAVSGSNVSSPCVHNPKLADKSKDVVETKAQPARSTADMTMTTEAERRTPFATTPKSITSYISSVRNGSITLECIKDC